MSLVVRGPVTPESAGWTYVGFEAASASFEGDTGARELCIVVLSGSCSIESEHGAWTLDGRPDPFSGPPDAAYLPPGTRYVLEGGAEVGLCSAPATSGAKARVLPGDRVVPETRGHGNHERTIHPILMGDEEADSLLVCEVLTPPGHWSSYPPHKHDRDAMPEESFLEETYYHRIDPPPGLRAPARVHRRRVARRDAGGARRRHRARAARLPHGLRAARLRALLPQRDGRTGARLGGRQRPRSRMDDDAMTSRLNPYITFPGTAREAMEFYKDVFGGELNVNTFGEFGGDVPNPDGTMHAQLETDRGFTLMASDMPPGMEHSPGNNMAVSLSGDDGDELRSYWEKLSAGGTVTMPFEKQMWGDEFGMCVDRFGVSWMVNVSQAQ